MIMNKLILTALYSFLLWSCASSRVDNSWADNLQSFTEHAQSQPEAVCVIAVRNGTWDMWWDDNPAPWEKPIAGGFVMHSTRFNRERVTNGFPI